MSRRSGRRERIRKRRQRIAAFDKDAAMLPSVGPIANLVKALSAVLARCAAAGQSTPEAELLLRPFGNDAFQLTGSIRGMIAVAWKARSLDDQQAEAGRHLIDRAWHGIGDERGVWTARDLR